MEIETPHSFDWANDAYLALNDPNMKQQQAGNWAYSGPQSAHNPAFTIPPSLLSQATVERYGQVTPPEDLSPAEASRDTRESSIPVEQLRNETFWPDQQQSAAKHTHTHSHSPPEEQELSQKRRRTSRQASTNQSSANNAPQADPSDVNPQPAKRKRGRPKSQPQMVEAYTADGFPFQVSSARQSHLEKNRVAAHKCRQRKKEYINGLEGRAREFSSRNKLLKENVAMLREEILGLKNEVLRHAGCGFWAVDEYLARCAGDLLGMEAPLRSSAARKASTQSPSLTTDQLRDQQTRDFRALSHSTTDVDDFGGLELLKDLDDDDMDELEQS